MDDKEVKLEFTVGEDDSSLVFEAPKKPVEKLKPQTSSSPELSVPDKFTVNSKFGGVPEKKTTPKPEKRKSAESPITVREEPTVRTTYVPRFTEVSETYKVSDSKTPRTPVAPKPKPEVVVVNVEEPEIDPTAETDEGTVIEDATLVTVGAPAPENYDIQSTVFKFETSEPKEEIPAPAPVEEEQEEIEEEFTPLEPISETPKEYKIPDPETKSADTALATREAGVAALESVENVGDATDDNAKKNRDFAQQTQRDSFKDRFLDGIMSIKVRLYTSLTLLLMLLVIENLWFFGKDIPAIIGISTIPGSMAVLDAIFIVCLFALALPEVVLAVHKMMIGRAVPELFVPVAALATIGYTAVVVATAPEKYPLFGLLFSLLSISAIVASLFKKLADFSNFKLISQPGEKRIVDRKLTRTLPEENLAVDGKVEGYKSKTARVFRTTFVADFFKRSGKCAENSGGVVLILAASFGLAFVAAAVAFFVPGVYAPLMSAAMTFVCVFLLGMPVFSILLHKIPFFHSVKQAESENSAVIGESSLYDYSGVDVVTFHDTEVFGEEDVNLQRIMLYGRSENLEKAMNQMSAVFAVVGGPLKNMFADALDHMPTTATRVYIEEEGIVARVDGVEVRAGTLEYMVKNGIKIPYDPGKESASLFSTKIMYAAENGEVYAKFYIRYTLSEDFTMILPSLADDGVIPLIYTRDPNVNSDLLRTLTAGMDSIRILKKQTLPDGEDKLYNRVSAGIVTMGDKIDVISMLLLCKKYVRLQQRLSIVELSAMAVGATLAVVLALSGMMVVPSLALAAWQLAWCGVMIFMSHRTLKASKDKNKQD